MLRKLQQVHAWLMHSVDCIGGVNKSGQTFWGEISATYNSTTEPHRHRTAKQLKDHWSVYNARVSQFNAYYNQEASKRQSGADDAMVMENAKARYARKAGHEFKLFHWWQAVRQEPKWSLKHGVGPSIDVGKRSRLGSSGDASSGSRDTTEEEVSRPMGRDRAKTAARREKGKGKESSSSGQSQSATDSGNMGPILQRLCKIQNRIATAKMWKQLRIMNATPIDDMTPAQKKVHARSIKRLEKELKSIEEQESEEEDEDDE